MNRSESKYFNTAKRMAEALLSLLNKKDFEYVTVKEICETAKVNRSTFYLHYETIADLLLEAIQLINEKFQASFSQKEFTIQDKAPEELFFMTSEWIVPYLRFIQENKHVYKAIHSNSSAFGVEKVFEKYFDNVFSPILSKYGVSKEKHGYIMDFYRHGLFAVIMRWINGNCTESAEYIAEIIKTFFDGQQRCGEPK